MTAALGLLEGDAGSPPVGQALASEDASAAHGIPERILARPSRRLTGRPCGDSRYPMELPGLPKNS